VTRRLLRHPVDFRLSAADAFLVLCGNRTNAFWLDGDGSEASYIGVGEPWAPAAPILGSIRSELGTWQGLGLVGWLGYELREETMGVRLRHPGRLAPAAFLAVDRVVGVSAEGRIELLARGESWSGELAQWRDETLERLRGTVPAAAPAAAVAPAAAAAVVTVIGQGDAHWHESREQYLANIAACQEAIRVGDAYLLNLTTEVEVAGSFDPLAVFLELRRLSPSHHAALIRIGDVSLVSSSPERFLRVDPDGTVATHPVKGTRPRSSDPAEDARIRDGLLSSEKERAENVMIVDLMRNDLGRVCEVGSVSVPELLYVESYEQVHQLVSSVCGRLREGLDAVDAVAACLPAGSMTGTPKLRATEILDSLENRERGLYSGVFGYFGFDGRADLAMTIRSIVLDATSARIGAGGGITALSVPAEEWAEVQLKVAAPLRALGVPQ
jgi:para-aminobenzoate synthetase component 1